MAEYQTFSNSANLSDGAGVLTDIELTPGSEFFLARPVYGTNGDDPILGGFAILRKADFDALDNASSDTPTYTASSSGDALLIVEKYNAENAADFGYFAIYRRNGKVGIVSKATSLTPEIIGIEIYEYPFQ